MDIDPPPPAIGQGYLYQHTGPRPWGDGVTDYTGYRAVRIREKVNEKDLWLVEEAYEKGNRTYLSFCDKDYLIHKQQLSSPNQTVEVIYKPALELRYLDLKKEETETDRTRLTFVDIESQSKIGEAVITDQTRRDYDVRIITKAGAYLCRQFHSDVELHAKVNGSEKRYSGTVISYWSDRIGWFVKQSYAFQPVKIDGEIVQPEYRAESILEDFEPKTW